MGNLLAVTKDGTFDIRVTTAQNGIYSAGRALATLTFELDNVAPVISGIQNGATYYTTQQAVVSDKNLIRVSLGGTAAEGPITLAGNTSATYTVAAGDAAINITLITVTMKPIASLVESIKGVTVDNVTSDNAAAIETIGEKLKAIDTTYATDAEKKELAAIERLLDALTQRIEDAADARNTESIESVKDITKENVEPEGREALEEAKADLQKAQQTYGGNYTDREAQEIQEDIDRINEALGVLERMEDIQSAIDALPDASEFDPENSELRDNADKLWDEYEALSDHEKSLLNADKLDALKSILTDYRVAEGAGSEWKKGSGDVLTFGSNGSSTRLVAIKVDDNLLSAEDYVVEDGCRTRVTLTAEYLETLSTGKHTLTMVYENGEASTTFVIKGGSLWWLWLILLLLLVAAVAITVWEIRRRQRTRA